MKRCLSSGTDQSILVVESTEHLNAITTQMVTKLRLYFDHLYENDQTRVVLMGGGKASVRAGYKVCQ